MSGNGTEADLDDPNYAHLTVREVLVWYDQLPPRLRELYDQLPEAVDPKSFYQCFRDLGEAGAYEYLYRSAREIWPGWDLINRRKKK